MNKKDCIFCKIAKQEGDRNFFMESDNFIAIFDINPVSKGHTLVIPKQHFVTLLDVSNKLGNEMLEFTKKVAEKILNDKYGDGFNLVMNNLEPAGQLVKHAHIHIIPRKEKDGIKIVA